METIREIIDRTGLTYGVIRFRMKKLNVYGRLTDDKNSPPRRVFTPTEAGEIENYQYGVAGRPWHKRDGGIDNED